MGSRAYVINGRFLSQNMTGVQRYAHNVVAHLDQRDAAVEIDLIAPSSAVLPSLKAIQTEVRGPLEGHLWEQLTLPVAAGRRRVLNLCNTAPVAKLDQIICVHDSNVFSAKYSYSSSFRMLYRNLQPLLVRRCAKIATVSHAAARQLARHLPIRLSEILVLPNGHEHALNWDPARAVQAPGALAARPADRPYVLAIGSSAPHKNLRLLAAIAPDLMRAGLDIVVAGGSGTIFNADTLQAQPNIILLGRIGDDDLAYLLDGAVCLVFPSLAEGFGLPAIEAMARGCPVVASDSASLPEVCGDAALLASPFAPEEWVSLISRLTASRDLREDLVGRGLEQVKKFSWSETATGYLDLLTDLRLTRERVQPAGIRRGRIAVVVATRGRPDIVTLTVRRLLSNQSMTADTIIISCVSPDDAGDLVNDPRVEIVTGPQGLAAQRNTALDRVPSGTEMVVFFDDDFVPSENWLAAALQIFRDENQIVGVTGRIVADGIKGPGIDFQEAVRLVQEGREQDYRLKPCSPYGCNMAFRYSSIGDLRFDERLVLYGWLEDRDFAARLAARGGHTAKFGTACGVHMGIKTGRVSGERLGYSQVVNPIYMMARGSMSFSRVAEHIFRNTTSNLVRAIRPEPFIDRKGRLKGNLRAWVDVLRGILEPERAATLPSAPSKSQDRNVKEVRDAQ